MEEESKLPHCRQLIDEYELMEQQAKSALNESLEVLELGVATSVQCRLTEKTTSRQGRPTVRCSFMGVV